MSTSSRIVNRSREEVLAWLDRARERKEARAKIIKEQWLAEEENRKATAESH